MNNIEITVRSTEKVHTLTLSGAFKGAQVTVPIHRHVEDGEWEQSEIDLIRAKHEAVFFNFMLDSFTGWFTLWEKGNPGKAWVLWAGSSWHPSGRHLVYSLSLSDEQDVDEEAVPPGPKVGLVRREIFGKRAEEAFQKVMAASPVEKTGPDFTMAMTHHLYTGGEEYNPGGEPRDNYLEVRSVDQDGRVTLAIYGLSDRDLVMDETKRFIETLSSLQQMVVIFGANMDGFEFSIPVDGPATQRYRIRLDTLAALSSDPDNRTHLFFVESVDTVEGIYANEVISSPNAMVHEIASPAEEYYETIVTVPEASLNVFLGGTRGSTLVIAQRRLGMNDRVIAVVYRPPGLGMWTKADQARIADIAAMLSPDHATYETIALTGRDGSSSFKIVHRPDFHLTKSYRRDQPNTWKVVTVTNGSTGASVEW